MGINQKDIKLLWGRSGNRCAICKTELTQNKNTVNSSFTLGEQAHIIGEKEDAARGKSALSEKERNSYHNLILLCPNHHVEIDKNEADWSVEKLYLIKSQHELWVTETLSETVDHVKLAENTVISSIVDNAVNLCRLESWSDWTCDATGLLGTYAYWDTELTANIRKFNRKVMTTIWSEKYLELRCATITLSTLLVDAIDIFIEHNDVVYLDDETIRLIEVKFYKTNDYNSDYKEKLNLYNEWKSRCFLSIVKATKAANWFAHVVRKEINPMFFAEKGRFSIGNEAECWDDLNEVIRYSEFTKEEKEYFMKKYML